MGGKTIWDFGLRSGGRRRSMPGQLPAGEFYSHLLIFFPPLKKSRKNDDFRIPTFRFGIPTFRPGFLPLDRDSHL